MEPVFFAACRVTFRIETPIDDDRPGPAPGAPMRHAAPFIESSRDRHQRITCGRQTGRA
jgi:hypothetical protein